MADKEFENALGPAERSSSRSLAERPPDKVDYDRVCAEAIGCTEMILKFGRTSRNKLTTYTLS
jgi:hypothetical protein